MKVTFKGEGLNLKEFKPPAPEKTPPADNPGAGKKDSGAGSRWG